MNSGRGDRTPWERWISAWRTVSDDAGVRARVRRLRLLRVFCVLAWLTCATTAVVIATVDVEFVVITGPIILLCGGIIVYLAWRAGDRPGLLLGGLHAGICLFFWGLVVALNWGPGRAHYPFLWMGTAYTILTAVPHWLVLRRRLPSADPYECTGCGYSLRCLTEPRCPECGRPFDPALPGRSKGDCN